MAWLTTGVVAILLFIGAVFGFGYLGPNVHTAPPRSVQSSASATSSAPEPPAGATAASSSADTTTYSAGCPPGNRQWVAFLSGVRAASLTFFVPSGYANTYCADDYATDGKQVYYARYLGGPGILEGADPATFKLLGGYGTYARDRRHVYIRGGILSGADPDTFTVLDDGDLAYAKDVHHVYFEDGIIPNADPASFSFYHSFPFHGTEYAYSHDNSHVYWMQFPLPGADIKTFTPLAACDSMGDQYANDEHHVFLNADSIPRADPSTFTVLQHTSTGITAYDKNHEYQCAKVVQ